MGKREFVLGTDLNQYRAEPGSGSWNPDQAVKELPDGSARVWTTGACSHLQGWAYCPLWIFTGFYSEVLKMFTFNIIYDCKCYMINYQTLYSRLLTQTRRRRSKLSFKLLTCGGAIAF